MDGLPKAVQTLVSVALEFEDRQPKRAIPISEGMDIIFATIGRNRRA